MKKLKVLLTGATGMVGEGVLHVCTQHPDVESILIVGRRPNGIAHEKVSEIVLPDLADLSSVKEQLKGYSACFFCLGVSSVGMSEEAYAAITYDLTLKFAGTLAEINPGMTFCYISGTGTDSSEQGSLMWARVKGKTENHLKRLPFAAEYNFRPGFIKPIDGMKNTLAAYRYLPFLYPILKVITPGSVVTLADLGTAMINAALAGYDKNVLECKDITLLAHRPPRND